jgi:hypothetical protein
MSEFSKFQKIFCELIQGEGDSSQLADQITPVGKLSSEKVLQVYREDFFARLTEALGSTFETTWEVLGDEDFLRLCNLYIRNNPSQFYSLGSYGREFWSLIEEEGLNVEIPFSSELAQFEWAFWETFHCINPDKRLNLDELNHLLANELEITFSDEVQLFKFENSIAHLWKCRNELGEMSVENFLSPECVIIGRGKEGVLLNTLTNEEFLLMDALKKFGKWEKATEELSFLHSWHQEQWAKFFQTLIQFLAKL